MSGRPKDNRDYTESTDKEAARNPAKTADLKGEAQNINDDNGRPLEESELDKARTKANASKGEENSQ